MKFKIIQRVLEIFEDAGFLISDCSSSRSCFDILARRDQILLLIKVLSNIEGLTKKNSIELRRVASITSGIPLVVGERMKFNRILDGVIYERYGLHVINPETLRDIAHNKMPLIYSVRGNYCVRINSKLLTRLRKQLGMTQEELASEVGISKQSIHRYENSGRISIKIARRLVQELKENILMPSEVFEFEQPRLSDEFITNVTRLKRIVLQEFRKIGFLTSLTNAPFDIVASETSKGEETILTIVSDDTRRLKQKADMIRELSDIMDAYNVCISNRNQDINIPIMKPGDLENISEPEELIEILIDS